MKLLLSEAEKKEISENYTKTTEAAQELASSISCLLDVLKQKMACLDTETKKSLDQALEKTMSTMFQIKMQNFRVENVHLEGREFGVTDMD